MSHDVTIWSLPDVSEGLRRLAKEDVKNALFIGDYPGDWMYPGIVIANAQRRGKKRGLYMDAYLLYVSYYIEEMVRSEPISETPDMPANETYLPYVEGTVVGA